MRAATSRALRTLWVGLVTVWVALTALALGDEIESRAFPVVTDQSVTDIRRVDSRLCWTWHFYKARSAAVTSFTWQLRTGAEDALFVIADTEGRPLQSSRTTPGGQWRRLPLCVDIPRSALSAHTITVDGDVSYDTGMPWRVSMRIATVLWTDGRYNP